jgi:predicted ArsR family transcriptional regulator
VFDVTRPSWSKSPHPSWIEVLSDPVRLNLLFLLSTHGKATAAELAARSPASERTVRRHLDGLVALGLAVETQGKSDGETAGRPAGRYLLERRVRPRLARLFKVLEHPLGP